MRCKARPPVAAVRDRFSYDSDKDQLVDLVHDRIVTKQLRLNGYSLTPGQIAFCLHHGCYPKGHVKRIGSGWAKGNIYDSSVKSSRPAPKELAPITLEEVRERFRFDDGRITWKTGRRAGEEVSPRDRRVTLAARGESRRAG